MFPQIINQFNINNMQKYNTKLMLKCQVIFILVIKLIGIMNN